jgi:hypothetical protein
MKGKRSEGQWIRALPPLTCCSNSFPRALKRSVQAFIGGGIVRAAQSCRKRTVALVVKRGALTIERKVPWWVLYSCPASSCNCSSHPWTPAPILRTTNRKQSLSRAGTSFTHRRNRQHNPPVRARCPCHTANEAQPSSLCAARSRRKDH